MYHSSPCALKDRIICPTFHQYSLDQMQTIGLRKSRQRDLEAHKLQHTSCPVCVCAKGVCLHERVYVSEYA